MERTLLSCLVLALTAIGAPPAQAQGDRPETRPVAVVSFSGYAELKRDLEYLGALSGHPDIAVVLEQLLSRFTKDQGLAGIDQGRPWGASLSITADGSQFPALAFLPVADLTKLLDALAAVAGQAVEEDNGIYEIKRGGHAYFVAQKGNWAYLAAQKSALEDLPDDPLQLLRDLDKQYDLALSLNVHNIPPSLRDMAAGLARQRWEAKLQQDLDEGDEGQNAPRAQLARRRADQAVQIIGELDQITVGLNIDREKHRTYLDLQMTALPGSDLAKGPAAGAKQPKSSRLADVLAPDAMFSLLLDWPLFDEDQELAKAWLSAFRDEFPGVIDGAKDLDDEQKAKAKKLTDKMLDILGETIEKEGRINFGLAVTGAKSDDEFDDVIGDAISDAFPNRVHETIIGAGQVTVVAGGLTADGAEWEDAAMQLVAMVAEAAGEDPPKLNVDKYKGRRFHAFSVMAPQTMRAEPPLRTLRNLLGNPLKIVLAFGDDTFYAAVGEKGADAIKRVIDRSAKMPADKLPPLTASLALGPTWNLALSQRTGSRSGKAASMAKSLEKDGKDHVQLTVVPTDDGLRCRVECEEGANKLLGLILSSAVRAAASIAGADRQ